MKIFVLLKLMPLFWQGHAQDENYLVQVGLKSVMGLGSAAPTTATTTSTTEAQFVDDKNSQLSVYKRISTNVLPHPPADRHQASGRSPKTAQQTLRNWKSSFWEKVDQEKKTEEERAEQGKKADEEKSEQEDESADEQADLEKAQKEKDEEEHEEAEEKAEQEKKAQDDKTEDERKETEEKAEPEKKAKDEKTEEEHKETEEEAEQEKKAQDDKTEQEQKEPEEKTEQEKVQDEKPEQEQEEHEEKAEEEKKAQDEKPEQEKTEAEEKAEPEKKEEGIEQAHKEAEQRPPSVVIGPGETQVQAAALSEATKAIKMRSAHPSHCVTTFDRNKLPVSERGLLVFTAPPILHELPEQMQSWNNALRGRGRFVVFTDDPETRRVCREHDIPVVCVQHVDEKLPRVDKMFEQMHNLQTSGITGYVNSDIALEKPGLLFDFMKFIGDRNLSLERRTVPAHVYLEFASTGVETVDWFAVVVRTDVSLNGKRSLHNIGGYDFWCWNRRPGGPPLLPVSIPPFRFPFGTYDNWVLDMMIMSGQRAVIDATAAVGIVHHEHKRVGGAETWYDALDKGVTGVFINRYLGYNEPRNSTMMHHWKFGTPPECPYVITVDNSQGPEPGFSIARRRYWSDTPEELLVKEGCYAFAENEPDHTRPTFMGCKRLEKVEGTTRDLQRTLRLLPLGLPSTPILSPHARAAAAKWRYKLAMMLKNHATADKFVLLMAVTYEYRGHLSNFICNLQRTGMRDHYLVAALDADMYEWGVLNGLPVYMPDVVLKMINEDAKGHASAKAEPASAKAEPEGYGSSVFKAATKLKSRAVLEILHAGYSVVWSDVDITWFVNPFDALSFFMKSGNSIAIQSNAPYVQTTSSGSDSARPHASVEVVKTDIPAGVRRLNSGLYVAPCTPLVVAAFEEIVAHAAKTNLSEQPSFYDVLCAGERTVDSCTYKPGNLVQPTTQKALAKAGLASAGLKVYLLDRFQYPNGAVLVGKGNENVYVLGKEKFEAATGKELYAAHNNWIQGEDPKIQRQTYRGWWFLEAGEEKSCKFRQAPPAGAYGDPHMSQP